MEDNDNLQNEEVNNINEGEALGTINNMPLESSEVENTNNNENNSFEVTYSNEVASNNNSEGQNKKKSKILPIILCVIAVIALVIVGLIIYSKKTFTADSFADRMFKNYKSNEILKTNDISNIIKKDAKQVKFSLDANMKLSILLEDSISINGALALDKNLFTLDGALKEGNEKLSFEMQTKDSKMYLRSEELLNKTILIENNENIVDTNAITSSFNNIDTKEIEQSMNSIKKLVDITLNSIKTMFKECKSNTKTSGLKATYEYTITYDDYKKVVKNIKEQIEADSKLKKMFANTDFDSILNKTNDEVITITITENMLNKKIENIKTKSYNIEAIGDDKYKVTVVGDNDNYFNIKMTDNEFLIEIFGDTEASFTIKTNGNKTSIKLSIKDMIDAEVNVATNDGKYTIEGKISSGNILGIDGTFKLSLESLNEELNEKTYSNVTTIDNLTYDDQYNLTSNLESKLNKMQIFTLFGINNSISKPVQAYNNL